jgi:hypothetical protein
VKRRRARVARLEALVVEEGIVEILVVKRNWTCDASRRDI